MFLANYRHKALVRIMSKVLENIVLDRLIKKVVKKYRGKDASLFICLFANKNLYFARFIDASKALDLVNHDTLFV